MFLKLIPRVTPLNAGGYKVLEGTHGTDPMGLRGGQDGLEKHKFIYQKVVESQPRVILWDKIDFH